MVVPTVLAMMARRNWLRCTSSHNAPDAMSATAMAPPPLFGRSVGRLSPARRHHQIVAASRGVGKEGG
jgi:hypothetical protein